jgi:hypothetical protein
VCACSLFLFRSWPHHDACHGHIGTTGAESEDDQDEEEDDDEEVEQQESAGVRRQRYGIAEALQRDEMAIYASSVPVAIPRRWVEEREDKKTPHHQAAAAAEEQAQAGLPPAEPPHSASPDEEDDDTVRQGLAHSLVAQITTHHAPRTTHHGGGIELC